MGGKPLQRWWQAVQILERLLLSNEIRVTWDSLPALGQAWSTGSSHKDSNSMILKTSTLLRLQSLKTESLKSIFRVLSSIPLAGSQFKPRIQPTSDPAHTLVLYVLEGLQDQTSNTGRETLPLGSLCLGWTLSWCLCKMGRVRLVTVLCYSCWADKPIYLLLREKWYSSLKV